MNHLTVPAGHALATFSRVDSSSLRTTVRKRYGRRCSIRSYHMEVIPMPGIAIADRPRAYAYAEGDLAHELSRVARSGSFTAVIAHPKSRRPVIVAIVDHEAAAAAARRVRQAEEDADWDAWEASRTSKQAD